MAKAAIQVMLAFSLLGCRTTVPSKTLDSTVITLERTACEGTCPVYTVTIDGSGLVKYVGSHFVDIPGAQTASIQTREVERLVELFDQIHFYGLEDRYFETCTDLPSEIIAISVDGRTKRISNYFGCGEVKSGPQVDLDKLAKEIDSVAGTSHWIKCNSDCMGQLVRSGLDVNSSGPDGTTPLMAAILRNEPSSVRLLLESGAQVNAADAQGYTPLMHAVMRQRAEIVRQLLAGRADVRARDAKGFTALQMTGDQEIRQLLIKAGRT